MLEKTVTLLLILPLALAGLTANVVVHETAHYATAEFFGYDSELYFNSTLIKNYGFLLNVEEIAHTSFRAETISANREILIAVAGPIANLIVALLALAGYYRAKHSSNISQLFFLAFFLTGIVAFVSNLLPYEFSDGAAILDLFAK